MRAITVIPRQAGSARLDEVPEPDPSEGALLADGLALGICGTDAEIIRGEYALGAAGRGAADPRPRVARARARGPGDSGLSPGDLVVGIVRRPDPVPCACCARGDWDFCRNGRYTERGIKELHGYGSERWRVEPEFAVRIDPALEDVGVLLEPTSVVAKAWEQIERIGGRACFDARRVLVTGAGPIGLLAALLAAQRGYEVHVLDHVTEGPKPDLVARLGGTYHTGTVADVGEVDIVIEATGVGKLVVDALGATARNGIVCLTGVSSGERTRRPRHRRPEPHDGARERRRVRLRQRQPPALRGRRRGARERRPRLAAGADHPPRPARPLAGGARAPRPTTSRSSSRSTPPPSRRPRSPARPCRGGTRP